VIRTVTVRNEDEDQHFMRVVRVSGVVTPAFVSEAERRGRVRTRLLLSLVQFGQRGRRPEERDVLHEVDLLLLFLLRVVDSFRPPIRQ
jgi:hypothetical protein